MSKAKYLAKYFNLRGRRKAALRYLLLSRIRVAGTATSKGYEGVDMQLGWTHKKRTQDLLGNLLEDNHLEDQEGDERRI
jgi:hypothetical protein